MKSADIYHVLIYIIEDICLPSVISIPIFLPWAMGYNFVEIYKAVYMHHPLNGANIIPLN